MTKMASMPIYGKNNLKMFFFRTISQMTLKPGTLEPYKVYINDDPGLTLVYFITRSTLFALAFTWETPEKKNTYL